MSRQTSLADQLGRIRQWFAQRVWRRVFWYTTARQDLLGHASDQFGLITVVGREHYEQLHRRYPIRRAADLRRVLRLEFSASERHFFWLGPLIGDEREVIVFRLRSTCPQDDLKSVFWVPESVIVIELAKELGMLEVDRDGCRYFAAPNGMCVVAGGVIQSAPLFALAAGLAADAPSRVVGSADLLARIPSALARLSLADWWGFRSPISSDRVREFAIPASAMVGLLLTIYLAVGSAYLWSMQMWRNQQLAALGPEVTSLLAQQRAVDLMASERRAITDLVSTAKPAWPLWQLAEVIWRASGTIYSITLDDDRINVRCTAPDATAVLKALQAVPGVRDVQFDAAVRQTAGGQEFVVTLIRDAKPRSKS